MMAKQKAAGLMAKGKVRHLRATVRGTASTHHEEPDRRRQMTPATTAMARMIQMTM
jgi:hypothetical protein